MVPQVALANWEKTRLRGWLSSLSRRGVWIDGTGVPGLCWRRNEAGQNGPPGLAGLGQAYVAVGGQLRPGKSTRRCLRLLFSTIPSRFWSG
jgi:hypothetical protein